MWVFYWLALRLTGLKPIRLTSLKPHRQELNSFKGFVIGGGDDVGAEIYDGDITLDVKIDPDRDRLEMEVLDVAQECGLPVLGVCRGAQILNAHRGGSLHQDIHAAYDDVPELWTPLPKKSVTLEHGTELHRIMRVNRFHANSLHRQSIDRLGRGLRVSATDRYGIVQAVECNEVNGQFLLGVQWHPEFMIYRSSQRRIFKAFKDAICNAVFPTKSPEAGSPNTPKQKR